MDEVEFDKLIGLYQKGLLSGRKKRLVEDWLNSTGKDIEVSFGGEDQLRLKNKILHEIKQQGGTTGLPQQAHGAVIGWRGIYKVAAAILLITVVVYTIWPYAVTRLAGKKILTAQSTGSIAKVFLPDGTLVWLKGHSTLTYPSDLSGETRNVTLLGEALFEVAKDAKHPFIIRCGDLTTTVLGTSFNIKSGKDSIEIIVLTGKVSLTTVHDTRGVTVAPGGKVVYNGRKRSISSVTPVPDEKVLAVRGTEYSMNFEDVRMNEVIPRIEKKFGVEIALSDQRLENCKITADFSDQSLAKTFSMLSQALQFEFEINENHVYLSGRGCD